MIDFRLIALHERDIAKVVERDCPSHGYEVVLRGDDFDEVCNEHQEGIQRSMRFSDSITDDRVSLSKNGPLGLERVAFPKDNDVCGNDLLLNGLEDGCIVACVFVRIQFRQ